MLCEGRWDNSPGMPFAEKREEERQMTIGMVLALLCGLALFLYGVTLLGDGLNKIAGGKFEAILARLIGSPVKSVLIGAVFSAIVQSSTATSIIAIGFLNSGMMQLSQAAYMILGSILGSSVTGWIVSLTSLGTGGGLTEVLSVANLTALVAIAGIFLRKFRRGARENNIGNLLLGFVILMTGMTAMSAAVEPLEHNKAFLDLMMDFSNPLLGFAVGLVFTAVIQSSAAAVGILQALSMTDAMTFSTAFPILLGIAVGGAVPVLLSVLGSRAHEVRAALMHLIMDICGAVLCGALFYIVNAVHPLDFADAMMDPVSIALINTVFRLFTVFILMPLVPVLVKITQRLIRDSGGKEESIPVLTLLEDRFLNYPTLALTQVQNAIHSMSDVASEGIRGVGKMLQGYSDELFSKMERMEDECDAYEDELGNYLMKILRHELNQQEDEEASLMLHAVSDIERISDYAMNMAHTLRELDEKGMNFSDKAHMELAVAQTATTQAVNMMQTAFESRDPLLTRKIVVLANVIDDLCEEMRKHHNRRLQDGTCTLEQGISFNDLLGNYENTVDRCRKLAYMLLELAEGTYGVHDYNRKVDLLDKDLSEGLAREYRSRFSLDFD